MKVATLTMLIVDSFFGSAKGCTCGQKIGKEQIFEDRIGCRVVSVFGTLLCSIGLIVWSWLGFVLWFVL